VYPFRYRHEQTGKWVRARYLAGLDEIAARYSKWEITGPPETRVPVGGSFSPYVQTNMHSKASRDEPPEVQPHLKQPPTIDGMECFLARTFLRRYITYCARRRRYSQMNGAARLYAEIKTIETRR